MNSIKSGRGRLRALALLGQLCSVGAVGCGSEEELAAAEQDEAGEEEAGPLEQFQQASTQSNAQIFSWSKGQNEQPMVPVSSHLCFLTRLSGEMASARSIVVVHHSNTNISDHSGPEHLPNDSNGNIVEDGDTWKIGGSTDGNNSLRGDATCVPKSDFLLGPSNVFWESGNVVNQKFQGGSGAKDLWLGNAISYIDGVHGWFEGGGEFAQIEPGWPNTPSQLNVRTQNSSAVSGVARSLFLGIPGVTDTRRTGMVSSSGNKKQLLLPTRDGVCYLTRISGDFNGSEERIRISPVVDAQGTEWWQFETHAGRGKAYATAECVLYNQS